MNTRTTRAALALSLSALTIGTLSGCPRASDRPTGTLGITSTAFTHEAAIPTEHTCEGTDTSPALAWTGIPEGAKTLALIVDDPDAPDPAAPKRTWVHWVVYDLPPTAAGLPAGVADDALPAGARLGTNDFERTTWGGPCPPIGRHRYFHKLFALDIALGDVGAPTSAELQAKMKGHVLAEAVLLGTYEKVAPALKTD